MKKLHKITILLLLTMLCLVALVACNNGLPTDDSALKQQGYILRVTFDGNGGKVGNSTTRLVYLKDNSAIPSEGKNTAIGEFVRWGYTHTDWVYEVEGDDGMPEYVSWNFKTEKLTKEHRGVQYNEAEGIYEFRLIPNWSKALSYEVVCIADNKEVHIESYTIGRNSRYDTYGFQLLSRSWSGYTFLNNYKDGKISGTGYYYDEACTEEIASYSELAPGGKAYPKNEEGFETFRIYTKWLEGSYKFVSSPTDFDGSSSNYYFVNDVDFDGVEFKPFTRAIKKIIGNGYTVRNIDALYETSGRNVNSIGLLGGSLTGATITDLTFENCILRVGVATYNTSLVGGHKVGFIAASLESSVISALKIKNCQIIIENHSQFEGVDNVEYAKLPEYNGAFNEVEESSVDGFIADISIYDSEGLGVVD